MDGKKYKLVGIYNFFEVIPCIIYPVFMDESGKLYSSSVDNGDMNENKYCFSKFIPLKEKDLDKVNYLDKCVSKIEEIQDYYTVGDVAVCGIELEGNGVYIGRIDKYLEFLKFYKYEFVENSECEFKEGFVKELEREIMFIETLVNKAIENGDLPRERNKTI